MAGDQPSVLLTKRSKLIPSHRGQVSFPGGRIEEGESSLDAALRESWEELHLKPEFVDTWGCMNPSLTSKLDESVVPVLAHVTRNLDELRLKPHCDEVLRLLMPDVYHPTVKVVQFQNRQ